MRYKVLMGGDLHKHQVDITTIQGYTAAVRTVQQDIMEFIRENGITHFVSLGDWYNSGYGSDTAAALAHTDIDREMAELLDGNFYGLIGNHIKIRMDSNPELFLIQPHNMYVSRHPVERDYQIIRTPKELILNGVQFHFMHWNKDAESAYEYKAMINKDCHYHVGLYHTEYIIPSHMLAGVNMNIRNDNSKVAAALDGIDLAVVGHVHKPIGKFKINKADGTATTMIVPGSLTNTDAGLISRHEYCDMPVLEIDDNGEVTLSFHRQSLHTELLTFYQRKISDETRDKLKSIYGNTKETLYEELEATTFVGEASGFQTLSMFMRQNNYTPGDKALVRNTIQSPDDIDMLMHVYKEDTRSGLAE